MKRLFMITSFAIAGSMVAAHSQDTKPGVSSDAKSVLAREIERGSPTETTGMRSSVLGTISLEAYLGSLEGGDFRAREVVLLPGAKIAAHAHHQRPAIACVLEGEIVERRTDEEEPMIRRKGDSYFEGPGLVHWVENVSPNRARVFSVDIVPREVE